MPFAQPTKITFEKKKFLTNVTRWHSLIIPTILVRTVFNSRFMQFSVQGTYGTGTELNL